MAYIAGIFSAQEAAATTNFVLPAPDGVQVGDYLVAMCARDNTTGTITCNWTIPTGGEITAGSIRMAVAYTRVTALPVAPCNFYNATADEWAGCVHIVRDAYYDSADADFIDIIGNNNDTAGSPYTATGLAVNYANSLILMGVGSDGAINCIPSGGNFVVEDTQDAGAVSFLSGWSVEPTDGTSDNIDFVGTTTTNSIVFLKLAIRNKTGGRVPAYTDVAMHDVIDTGSHRERAAAGYTHPTTTADFMGWEVRDPDYVFLDDGGVFTDKTAAATNDTDADVAFPAAEALNDAYYIGDAAPFNSLVVDRMGCTIGVAGVLALEYWNGTAWVAPLKRLDLTTNFTTTLADRQVIQWRAPTNWATTTVNSVSAYWIRLRITTLYTTNPTLSRIRVAEAGLVYDAYGSISDTGVVPFWTSTAVSPATTMIGVHVGCIRDLGSTLDLHAAERYLLATYVFTSPREHYDTGAAELGYGVRMPLLDSSNNYRSWTIGGFGYPGCRGDARNIWAIQPSQTIDTAHAASATAPDFNNFRKWVITQGSYTDEVAHIYHSYMVFANRAIIYGGASDALANWSDIKRAINGTRFPHYSGGQLHIPVQFGGSKPCKVDCQLAAFDFVKVAGSKYGGMIHVDPGVLGVIIKASAGDIVKVRNSTITSESLIRFEVDAASSGSATYDFHGTTVVNATVTLRNVASFDGMNFINCPTFTQNGAALDGCNFSDTKVASATLAAMEDITNCAFASSGTGHAIEVSGSASTISFSGNTFTGYASSNGSTGNEAIYVNIATGTVTINIAGGGSTPSIRTAGATVVVNNSVTLTLTGLVSGSDIVIRTHGTTTMRAQVDAHGSTSYGFAYSYAASDYVDIEVYQPGYIPWMSHNYLLANSDASLPVSQVVDPSYVA
jgi:hypothetical protein